MDLSPILQPLEEGAVTAAGLAITAGVGLGLKWASSHLAFLRTAAGAKMAADANTVIQAATQNASASIVAGIQSGKIDPTNCAADDRCRRPGVRREGQGAGCHRNPEAG